MTITIILGIIALVSVVINLLLILRLKSAYDDEMKRTPELLNERA